MSRLDFAKFVKNRLASLVSFDNQGTDISATNVQAAIAQLGGRDFGKNYGYTETVGPVTVSSPTDVVVAQITLPNAPAGLYRLSWSFTVTNSKSATTSHVTVKADPSGTVFKTFEHAGITFESVSGFKGNYNHSGGDLTFQITTNASQGGAQGQAVGGPGNSIISDANLEGWRVS